MEKIYFTLSSFIFLFLFTIWNRRDKLNFVFKLLLAIMCIYGLVMTGLSFGFFGCSPVDAASRLITEKDDEYTTALGYIEGYTSAERSCKL